MKKIFFLAVLTSTINVSCQKDNKIKKDYNNDIVSTIDTLYNKPTSLYFDNDNVKDETKVLAKQNNNISDFVLSIHLSSLNKTFEIPILNNSVLYNNMEATYYLSDPIIQNQMIELHVSYANQPTKPNISGDKKDLIEKIKFKFNPKDKKIQVIGYDLSYYKDNKNKFIKSFNFITGRYYCSGYRGNDKKSVSGFSSELNNIYIENLNADFINKLISYGNEIE